MKAWKHASLWTSILAAMLLGGGGCDFGDPVDHASGGGTSIDGLTGNLVVTGGAPAAGAMVRVFSAGGSSGALAKSALVSEALALDSVQANSAGRFQFKDLPDGTYNLTASLRLADNTVLALYLPGIIVAGRTNIGVDTLQLSGSIVLQVHGTGNASVPGALCAIAGGAWQANSDSSGTCTLTGVPPGIFQATITHPSYLTGISADVTVTGGMSTSGGVVILTDIGNGPAAKRPIFFSMYLPDSVSSASLNVRWDLHIHRLVFKVNGTTITDSTRLPRFQPSQDHGFFHDAFNAGGGDIVELSAYGRVEGGPFDLMQGWDTTKPLFRGSKVLLAADSAVDTLAILLNWVGPLPPDTGSSTPPAPTPTYPLTGALNVPATATFTWNAVSGATGYHLEVVNANFVSNPLVNDSTLTVTSRAAGPLEYLVTYGWRVRARNAAGWGPWSATSTIFRDEMPTATPTVPQLNSPATNAVGVAIPSNHTWNQATGATHYHIQVSQTENFTTHLLNDSMLTTTSRSFANADFSTTYYWRVRARGAAGSGPWSEIRTYTTAAFVDVVMLTTPVLSAPADLATNLALTPTLAWSPSNGAMTYQVQLSMNAAFTTMLVNDSTVTTTSRAVGPLTAATAYYWRVRAKSPSGNSVYSTIRSFTTAASAGPTRDTTLVAWQDSYITGYSHLQGGDTGSNITRNYGKATSLPVGALDLNTIIRALVQFQVPADLTGAKISKAILRVYGNTWWDRDIEIMFRIYAHRLLRSWKEGNATNGETVNSASIDGVTALERFWGPQDGSENWNKMLIGLDGVDAEAAAAASTAKAASYVGYWDFDLTALAKSWADNPAQNFGVVLRGEEAWTGIRDPLEDFPSFHSREAAVADSLKPQLILTISP